MVNTVCGAIDKKELGKVLPHEHLLIDLDVFAIETPENSQVFHQKLSMSNLHHVLRDPYFIRDNAIMDSVDVAIKEVELFAKAGGRTIVDVTLDDIGRDPLKLKTISEKTGVNIVMGCGHYVDKAHSDKIRNASVKELADEMIKDITVGVRDTGIKAGIIGEIGTSAVVTESEWKNVEAAGIAHIETGKAIHVHTSLYERNGLDIAKKLLSMGVNPQKLVIDHIDVDIREDYILELLDLGINVEFDNFGKEFYIPKREGLALNGRFAYDLERAETIAKLVEKGYVKQLLLTNDICIKNMLTTYGGFGYSRVFVDNIPMLKDCGVSKQDIDTMIIDNPAQLLD